MTEKVDSAGGLLFESKMERFKIEAKEKGLCLRCLLNSNGFQKNQVVDHFCVVCGSRNEE